MTMYHNESLPNLFHGRLYKTSPHNYGYISILQRFSWRISLTVGFSVVGLSILRGQILINEILGSGIV